MDQARHAGPPDHEAKDDQGAHPGLAGDQANRSGHRRAAQPDQQRKGDVVGRSRRKEEQPAHEGGPVVLEAVILGRGIRVKPGIRDRDRRPAHVADDVRQVGDLLRAAIDVRVGESPQEGVAEDSQEDAQGKRNLTQSELPAPGGDAVACPGTDEGGLPRGKAKRNQPQGSHRANRRQSRQGGSQAMVAFDPIDQGNAQQRAQGEGAPAVTPVKPGQQHHSPYVRKEENECENQP